MMYPTQKLILCGYAIRKGNVYKCRLTGEIFANVSRMRCPPGTDKNDCARAFALHQCATIGRPLGPNISFVPEPIRNVGKCGQRTIRCSDHADGEDG